MGLRAAPTTAMLVTMCVVAWARPHHTAALELSPDSLRVHVDALVGTTGYRNHANPAALEQAAQYITLQLQRSGLKPVEQSYTVGDVTYRNITAVVGPPSGKRIVVGAHYDVCGDQPGADDNASGVAVLLETARLVRERAPDLRRPVEFVAYTLEEPPYYDTPSMGSAVHALSLRARKLDVYVMVSLEMVGYFTDEPGSQRYPLRIARLFYPSRGNYIAALGTFGSGAKVRQMRRTICRTTSVRCCSLVAPQAAEFTMLSDNRNYVAEGYDAMMITDTSMFRNGNYHRRTDTPETLDYGRMAEVAKGVAHYLLR